MGLGALRLSICIQGAQLLRLIRKECDRYILQYFQPAIAFFSPS